MVKQIFFSCFEFLNTLDFVQGRSAIKGACNPESIKSQSILMDDCREFPSCSSLENQKLPTILQTELHGGGSKESNLVKGVKPELCRNLKGLKYYKCKAINLSGEETSTLHKLDERINFEAPETDNFSEDLQNAPQFGLNVEEFGTQNSGWQNEMIDSDLYLSKQEVEDTLCCDDDNMDYLIAVGSGSKVDQEAHKSMENKNGVISSSTANGIILNEAEDNIDFTVSDTDNLVESLQNFFQASLQVDSVKKKIQDRETETYGTDLFQKQTGHEEVIDCDKTGSVTCLIGKPKDEQKVLLPEMEQDSLFMYTGPSLSLQYSSTSNEMLQTLDIIDTKKHHELNNAICNLSTSTSSSFKLISALRGGREKSGLGAKPKLSVRWAPDVQEPRSSSHYRFVRGQRSQNSRKKDHKQRSKGKIGYKSGSSRNEKKHKSKRSRSFDSAASRFGRNWPVPSNVQKPMMGWDPLIQDVEENDDILGIGYDKSYDRIETSQPCYILSSSVLPTTHLKCSSRLKCSLQNKHLPCAEAA